MSSFLFISERTGVTIDGQHTLSELIDSFICKQYVIHHMYVKQMHETYGISLSEYCRQAARGS
jgi:hypothetical protein